MRTTSRLEYVETVLPMGEGPTIEGDDIIGVQVLSVEPVGALPTRRWRFVVKHVTRVPTVRAQDGNDYDVWDGD